MDTETLAYIDETGNTDLETFKDGASNYFIVSAIIVSKDKKQELEEKTDALRLKYFQTGEIKSSGVGNNNQRRTKILAAVNELNFKFYAICVDKEKIYKDSGLQYKKSFLKYINGKLYNRLFTSFLDIHVISDEHGGEDFKNSFKKYIQNNHKPDMFYKSKFDLVNSKSELLVQLSDFVVGTVSKIYEGRSSPELNEEYIKLISTKALDIDEWPTRYQAYFSKDDISDEYSNLIYSYSLAQAEKFIEKNEKSIELDVRIQAAVLRHIVFYSRFISKNEYISTTKIIDYLFHAGFGTITTYALRSKVVAPLRDSDVIITSSNKGYKIPCSFNDMEEFVERVNSIIKPLLSRLGRARKNLYTASKGELEILKGANYPHLVDFINTLEKYKNAKI